MDLKRNHVDKCHLLCNMITQKLLTTASKALVYQEGEGERSELSLKLYLIIVK